MIHGQESHSIALASSKAQSIRHMSMDGTACEFSWDLPNVCANKMNGMPHTALMANRSNEVESLVRQQCFFG